MKQEDTYAHTHTQTHVWPFTEAHNTKGDVVALHVKWATMATTRMWNDIGIHGQRDLFFFFIYSIGIVRFVPAKCTWMRLGKLFNFIA